MAVNSLANLIGNRCPSLRVFNPPRSYGLGYSWWTDYELPSSLSLTREQCESERASARVAGCMVCCMPRHGVGARYWSKPTLAPTPPSFQALSLSLSLSHSLPLVRSPPPPPRSLERSAPVALNAMLITCKLSRLLHLNVVSRTYEGRRGVCRATRVNEEEVTPMDDNCYSLSLSLLFFWYSAHGCDGAYACLTRHCRCKSQSGYYSFLLVCSRN